jgi:succinate dehydrogenase/fumarate reductase flavoprotein subunit
MEGEVERWLGVCEDDRGVDVTEFELKPSVVTIVGKRNHRVMGGIEIP